MHLYIKGPQRNRTSVKKYLWSGGVINVISTIHFPKKLISKNKLILFILSLNN